MKTAFVRHLIVCAAALVLADAWADTWIDPDTGYTWTYRITKEDSAEIYNNNSCAISPSPTGALIIPSSLDGKPVTSIGAYALYECNRLTSVAIPDSVTGVGRYAFTGCTNLTGVYITDLTAWCRIHFDQWGANPLEYAHNLYINGTLLEDLIIPDGVTSIECHAFNGGSCFTSVTIPSGVTNIDAYAFYECTGLRAAHTSSLIDWFKISFYGKYDNPLIYARKLYVDVPIEEDMFPIPVDWSALWYVRNLDVDLYVGGSIVEDFIPIGVDLNAAGGRVSVGQFIAYSGWQIDELPTPIRTGYAFLGWFTLAEGGERVSCGMSCETNMTLFAHWEKEKYTIVFNSFLEEVEIAPRTRLYGEAIGELPVIEVDRYGYTFGGWENVNAETIVTGNMTISAVWHRNVYTVSFDAHAGGEEIGNMEKFYEEPFGDLPQPTWSGHVFLGWYTDELGGEEIKAADKVMSDITLHAHWAEGPFEIEVGGAQWSYQTYSGVATIISATANEDSLSIPEMLGGAVVVEIPTDCFAQVANLKCVAIPASVTNIGAYAFYNCTNLEEIVFNEGLQKIESGAFAKCEKLRTVTLPTTLVSLGDRLAPARFTDVYDSQLFLYIDDFLANGTNFVDEAAGYEFLCDSGGSFEETNTGDSETSTETHGTNETFWTTALFNGEGDGWTITCVCSNNYLSSTRFERNEQNVYLSTISATNSECAVFGVNNAMGVFEGCKALESVSLSFGLREIGAGTFKDCVSLGSLDIPDSVVSIGGHGEHVEQTMSNTRCSVFDKLQVDDLAPSLLSSEQSVSDDRNNRTYEGSGFVQGCISLTNIVLPSFLSYLGPYSFAGCTSLRDVDLPDLLRTVNEGTFSGCSALETVKLPESLDLIGGYEFTPRTSRVSLCDSLCQNGVRSVLISDQEISIQYDEEGGVLCSDMLSQNGASCCVSCYLRTNITHNADGTFNIEEILIENDLTTNMTSYVAEYDDIDLDNRWQDGVETVFVPRVLEGIAESGGCDCFGELMDFVSAKYSESAEDRMRARRHFCPSSPTYNGKTFAPESGVFSGCVSLKSVVLPNTVRRIADYAFYNCSSLAAVKIPDSLEVVGYKAFGCDVTPVPSWTVSFNANGGVVEDGWLGIERPITKVTVEKGKAVGVLPVPEREGYAFAGWWTAKTKGTKISASTKVTKNVTYYARWTVNKYKVSAAVSAKAAGKVSGAGTKTFNGKVTLKATPTKGYVFVKWENLNDPDTPWPSALTYRQPSVSFKMGAANLSVRAVFAKKTADSALSLMVDPSVMWYVEDDPDREIAVVADSLSYPTVTLSGASAGIGLVRVAGTDNAYVLKVTDSSKMNPGVYTAKVTAKNRAGKSVAKSVKIVTPNSSAAIDAGLIAGLKTSTLSPYVASGGMKTKWTLADLGVDVFATNGWKLVSVTGLPTGLSWNGTAIVGTASKVGVYTVTFKMQKTVKVGKKTKTYTSTASATFKVEALLPGELAGTYNGFANTSIETVGGDEENPLYAPFVDGMASAVKVSVTTAGKITANVGGVALSGTGFDDVTNGVYSVMLKKTQKITKGLLKGKSKVWELRLEIAPDASWDSAQLTGTYTAYTTGMPSMAAPTLVVAQRNAFSSDAAAKEVAAAVVASGNKGAKGFVVNKAYGEDYAYTLDCAECVIGGKAVVTATAKANGTVVLAGTIAKTKVSGTAVLDVSPAAEDVYEEIRTATARFFTSKFVIEVVYTLEDGEVVGTSGRVWKK